MLWDKGSGAGKWVRVTVTPEALAEVPGSSQTSTAWKQGEEAPTPKAGTPRSPAVQTPTRNDVDDVVGDAQGLVELLGRGDHLIKHLP